MSLITLIILRADGPEGKHEFRLRIDKLAKKRNPRLKTGVSKATASRIAKELGLSLQRNDVTTKARYVACTEARNFASMAIMAIVLGEDVPDALLLNTDDTQVKLIGKVNKWF